jgi:D-xylulose reductase
MFVLIQLIASQVHFWKEGGFTRKVSEDHPVVMGHEASGTIHSIGSDVSRVQVGDRVAIEPGVPCRHCKPCKDGFYNLCKDMKFAAAPPDCHGTLTKYWKIAEDFVYKIPDSITLEEAVLVEPLAVGVHAARLANIRPGETVVVMGSGTIGLLCGAVAKVFGAHRIILVDIMDKKLEFAWDFQDCETFKSDVKASAEENASSLLSTMGLQEHLVDTVIEASGAASSIETGIYILRPGGKYVQTGIGRQKIEFPIVAMSEKELYVRGAFRYGSGDFELATSLIGRGIVNVKKMISSVVEFEQTTEAWDKTARGEGIKNLIRGVRD